MGFPLRVALLLTSALVVAACAERIEAPTASITVVTERDLHPGTEIVLDGLASSDPNAEADLGLTFQWRIVSAPAGSMASFNAVDLPLVSFVPDEYGDYTVGLAVSNGMLWSEEATEVIAIEGCGNEAPEITGPATDPAAPITEHTVQLSATWTDADVETCGLEQEMSWDWAFTALPSGSAAELNDPQATNPSFVADEPGDYGVALVITDDTGRPSPIERLTVTVSACGDAPPVVDTVDVEPTDPGVNQLIELDIAVSDADQDDACLPDQVLDVISHFVSRPAGSDAVLNPAEGLTPAFVADVEGLYVVRTVVEDDTGRTGFEDTTIDVGDCGTHVPTITLFETLVNGAVTALDGDGVLDTNTGDLVGITWAVDDEDNDDGGCDLDQVLVVTSEIIGAPPGSLAAMAPPVGTTVGFTTDVSGDYLVRATVIDDTGRSATLDLLVTASECGEHVPHISFFISVPDFLGDDPDPHTGEFVSIEWYVDDVDNHDFQQTDCDLGQALDVYSEIVSAPAGSMATISPSVGTYIGFTPDLPASVAAPYVIRATVTDDTGRSSWTELEVPVDECGSFPPDALVEVVSPVSTAPASDFEQAVVEDDVVIALSAAASFDPDLEPACGGPGSQLVPGGLSYGWWFAEKPAGSRAAFNDPGIVNPSFYADVPGIYKIVVQVSDGAHDDLAVVEVESDPSLFIITADGFDIEFVTGGTDLWDHPEGIALDDDGNIYVVQNGLDRVTITTPDALSTRSFSLGGFLGDPHDIVFDAPRDQFFVSNRGNATNDRVILLDDLGRQTPFNVSNQVDEPTGLAIDGSDLAVADWDRDSSAENVRIYDAAASSLPTSSGTTRNFGGNLENPWGIAFDAGTLWAADDSGDVWRWNDSDGTALLVGGFDWLRDLALVPSDAGEGVVVAEPDSGGVYLIE
ncbi:MAG: hypothetical protein JRJ84_21680, partial [Deltaproteobacteria bacterium]|nr:hypothetical protein [Deltaproteobacteria bacterium]